MAKTRKPKSSGFVAKKLPKNVTVIKGTPFITKKKSRK
jgi:hypothetical protein|tara:strand:+ start:1043 stop:1156 length:114 start_codon:yes stop_codon:yes gene_type:complete